MLILFVLMALTVWFGMRTVSYIITGRRVKTGEYAMLTGLFVVLDVVAFISSPWGI